MAGATDDLPWNEGSALEELERIKQAIDECRRRRKDLQAEFDGFVRSFRTSARDRPIAGPDTKSDTAETPDLTREPHPVPAGSSARPWPDARADVDTVPEVAVAPAAAEHQPEPAALFGSPVAAFPVAASPSSTSRPAFNGWRTRRTGLLAVAAAVAVVAIAAFLMSRSGPGTSQATPSAAVSRSAGPVRPAAPSTPAPSDAAAPAANAGPPRSEIVAVRRVWVRVVVDGVKTSEREMEAGERVTLPAGSTAVIRAGNAGAVRVTVNGEDRGLLGAEGEVLTRTVRIPAAAR